MKAKDQDKSSSLLLSDDDSYPVIWKRNRNSVGKFTKREETLMSPPTPITWTSTNLLIGFPLYQISMNHPANCICRICNLIPNDHNYRGDLLAYHWKRNRHRTKKFHGDNDDDSDRNSMIVQSPEIETLMLGLKEINSSLSLLSGLEDTVLRHVLLCTEHAITDPCSCCLDDPVVFCFDQGRKRLAKQHLKKPMVQFSISPHFKEDQIPEEFFYGNPPDTIFLKENIGWASTVKVRITYHRWARQKDAPFVLKRFTEEHLEPLIRKRTSIVMTEFGFHSSVLQIPWEKLPLYSMRLVDKYHTMLEISTRSPPPNKDETGRICRYAYFEEVALFQWRHRFYFDYSSVAREAYNVLLQKKQNQVDRDVAIWKQMRMAN